MRGRSLPLLLVAGAVVVQLVPALGAVLIFDRVAVDAGEYWRVVTGTLVHFSWVHLAGDAAVLVVAGWLSDARAAERAVLFAGAMTASGVAVLLFAPELRWYGGLSGVAHSVVVYESLKGLEHRGRRRALSCAVLAMVAAKLVIDIASVRPVVGSHDGGPVLVAGVSHLGAVAWTLALFAVVRWRRGDGRRRAGVAGAGGTAVSPALVAHP